MQQFSSTYFFFYTGSLCFCSAQFFKTRLTEYSVRLNVMCNFCVASTCAYSNIGLLQMNERETTQVTQIVKSLFPTQYVSDRTPDHLANVHLFLFAVLFMSSYFSPRPVFPTRFSFHSVYLRYTICYCIVRYSSIYLVMIKCSVRRYILFHKIAFVRHCWIHVQLIIIKVINIDINYSAIVTT